MVDENSYIILITPIVKHNSGYSATPKHRREYNIKMVLQCQLDLSRLKWAPMARSYERGNAYSGYIKCGKFLEQLSICQILKNDFVTYSLLIRCNSR